MRCCGDQGHVIELRGGSEPLRLVRCGTCQRREWHLGAETVGVEAAFEVLAQTYRTLPRPPRASRERTATQAAARAAAPLARASAAATTEVDRGELFALLEGWTVLGVSA